MNAKDASREYLEAFFHLHASCANCKYISFEDANACCYPIDPIGPLFEESPIGIKKSPIVGIHRCNKWESHYIEGCIESSNDNGIVIAEVSPNE